MKEAHKKFARIFMALLPPAASFVSFADAFWTGVLVSTALLFVTYLFLILKPLFPARLFRAAVILFLAALFQIFQGIFHASPFWIVSLALLLDWNDYDPKHLGQRPIPPLVRAAIFCGGALFLGSVRELLGSRLGMPVFHHPAGACFSLAAFSAAVLGLEKPMAPLWLKKRSRG